MAVLSLFGARVGYSVVAGEAQDVEEGEDADDDIDPTSDEFVRVDIPEDAYGAAMLAFVRDVPTVFGMGRETWDIAATSCMFSLVVLVVNLVLQMSILAYVFRYVVNPDVGLVQDQYLHFRRNVFDSEGTFRDDLWSAYEGRTDLCQIAMWNRPFYYAVLFCWTLVMLIEIRKSEELIRHIMRVPVVDHPAKMLLTRGGERYVMGFTPSTRFFIMAFVAIPKMSISIILLWLGCEWLSATVKFESLVMNTVAMAFIVNIDEILFEAVLPHHHRSDVQNIDFLLKRPAEVDSAEAINLKKRAFRRSLVYMICAMSYLVVYAEYLQDVLPPDIRMLRDRCQEFIEQTQQPFCNGWTWYLRGNPSAHQCFPLPEGGLNPPLLRNVG